jgi:3-hydroxymyristoyl/3-hydroxydecanoyl-(acyl carrier protein) dehydratase
MQEFDLDTRPVRLPDPDHGFPRILSVADDAANIRLCLDISHDLSWFRGHFPGQPVLPGVIQLHWAVIVACACFDFAEAPTAIKRLKFKKIITPPQVVDLSVSVQRANEVQFGFFSSGAQYSEGRLVFPESKTC